MVAPNNYTKREKALLTEQYKVKCLLAEALGYAYDPEFGWVTGDHTIVTLAMEVLRRRITTPPPPITREAVALAHHRYYCHENGHACNEVDQYDYDYADILGEILAVAKEDAIDDGGNQMTKQYVLVVESTGDDGERGVDAIYANGNDYRGDVRGFDRRQATIEQERLRDWLLNGQADATVTIVEMLAMPE